MCMACQMDELWMLYLEQQASKPAATEGAGTSSEAVDASDTTGAAPNRAPGARSPFACEDPTKA
jgi:hypothetical protein